MAYSSLFNPAVSQYITNIILKDHFRVMRGIIFRSATCKLPTREFELALWDVKHSGYSKNVQDQVSDLLGRVYENAVEKDLLLRFDPRKVIPEEKHHLYQKPTIEMTKEQALEAVKNNIKIANGAFFAYLKDYIVIARLSDIKKARYSEAREDLVQTLDDSGKRKTRSRSAIYNEEAEEANVKTTTTNIKLGHIQLFSSFQKDADQEHTEQAHILRARLNKTNASKHLEYLEAQQHDFDHEDKALRTRAKAKARVLLMKALGFTDHAIEEQIKIPIDKIKELAAEPVLY